MDFLPDSGMICRISGAKMTKRARRNHTSAFKAKVALAAIKGEMRIPTKPATNSNRKPATDSDLKPAGIPI